MGTYALNSFKRSLKRTHVHGSHTLFLQVVLVLPLVWTYQENVTCQISLGKRNIHRHHARNVAWAVIPEGQLPNVGVELLYALYELVYANPLGLLEHVGKVVLFLLSCVVGKHTEKVEHNAFVKWLTWKSPCAFHWHALKILEWISLRLLPDYLVPRVLGIQRQQVCIELKHLGRSGFTLVLSRLFCKNGLVVEGLVLAAKF